MHLPENVEIECKEQESEIHQEDIDRLNEKRGRFRGHDAVLKRMKERFRQGAHLWLIIIDRNTA